MATIQQLRKIGACENKQAQAAEWKGPAIDACPAPAAFLCEVCGFLLCGGHASGHGHAAGDAARLPSALAAELAAADAALAASEANAAEVAAQLQSARARDATVAEAERMLEGGH